MKHVLSPGKWRRLGATTTYAGHFTILAFDQRGNFQSILPEGTPFETFALLKAEVVQALSPDVSAVLLDPIFGMPAINQLSHHSGLLLALEKTGYAGTPTHREIDFMPGWDIDKIARLGGSAVKLLVYYHPFAGKLTEALDDVIREVAEQCQAADMPLFLEPLSYSLDERVSKNSADFAKERPTIIIETARRLSTLGADVLKLEFPVDAHFDTNLSAWRSACMQVTDAATIPWTLLSAGVDYNVFKDQVGVACQAGASGFIGGRAIWKECITMSPEARQEFLITVARPRLYQLADITAQYATPWTDFFTASAMTENWYERY